MATQPKLVASEEDLPSDLELAEYLAEQKVSPDVLLLLADEQFDEQFPPRG
ncbi:MAG: hypothetical protein V4474_03060 [Patescibacteria group bacterium]